MAEEHDTNRVQVPTFSNVLVGVKEHFPSEPPPKQATSDVYDEHGDKGMQLTPLETHITP